MKKIILILLLFLLSCQAKQESKADNLWGRLDNKTQKKIVEDLSQSFLEIHKICKIGEVDIESNAECIHIEIKCTQGSYDPIKINLGMPLEAQHLDKKGI